MNAFILLTACVATSSAQYVAHTVRASNLKYDFVHGVVGAYPIAYAAGAPIVAAGAIPSTYATGAYPAAYAAGAYPAAYAAGAPIVAARAIPSTYAAGAYPAAYAARAPVVAVGAIPATYAAATPVVAATPLNPSSQFQAQDEFGNFQYGYANINSQKHEIGNSNGGVQGSYSYVDANGIVQTTNYIADGLGFRVQATNLPVAPATPEVELPEPVTPIAPRARYPAGYAGYSYAGLPAPAVAPAAVVASAPATAEAILTTVKLNPGHAVAYRVY